MRDLPRGTQVVDPEAGSFSLTGLSPSLARPSRRVLLTTGFVTLQEPGRFPVFDSYNPSSETAATYYAELGLGYSRFARHYSGNDLLSSRY